MNNITTAHAMTIILEANQVMIIARYVTPLVPLRCETTLRINVVRDTTLKRDIKIQAVLFLALVDGPRRVATRWIVRTMERSRKKGEDV